MVSAVITVDQNDPADTQLPKENGEESDLTAIDSVEDIVIDDDEDFQEELRVAQEKMKMKTMPDEASEKKDLNLHFDNTAVNLEEEMLGFAKHQLNRMEFVRYLLSSIPNEAYSEESFQIDQIMTLPLRQRWMLFGQWKRVYREIIEQDVRKSKEEYESQIKEYNQL